MSGEVILRDVIESDLPVLYVHQLDPASVRMAAFKSRNWDAFQTHWAKILADTRITTRTIVVDGRVVGHVGCWDWSGEMEVGYWVERAYWGRGIATRALSMLLGLVAERPLIACVAKHNAASIRVLEKCGFAPVREGAEDVILRLGADD